MKFGGCFAHGSEMKRRNVILCAVLVLLVLPIFPLGGCSSAQAHPPAQTASKSIPSGQEDLSILQKWSGDFPLAELQRLPVDQRASRTGYIGDQLTFASVWEAFKPGEALPAVDFSRQLVIFSRNTTFYNRMSIGRVLLDHGVAEPLVMETMSAMPLEGRAAMALALVPRAGVVSIKGNASPVPSIQSGYIAPPATGGRFVGEYKLPNGMTAVVAEGDREPRSIGSYSVRIYDDLHAGRYISGTIRPRDGFIREVRAGEVDRNGRDEIVVFIETAGSGRYVTTDIFSFDGRNLSIGEESR